MNEAPYADNDEDEVDMTPHCKRAFRSVISQLNDDCEATDILSGMFEELYNYCLYVSPNGVTGADRIMREGMKEIKGVKYRMYRDMHSNFSLH